MHGRYRPVMTPADQDRKDGQPSVTSTPDVVELMQQRIDELEQQIGIYEDLLEELPDLFEQKFQQRLEPLLERYRLLAEQLEPAATNNRSLPPSKQEPDRAGQGNLIRFPLLRFPRLMDLRQRPSA